MPSSSELYIYRLLGCTEGSIYVYNPDTEQDFKMTVVHHFFKITICEYDVHAYLRIFL